MSFMAASMYKQQNLMINIILTASGTEEHSSVAGLMARASCPHLSLSGSLCGRTTLVRTYSAHHEPKLAHHPLTLHLLRGRVELRW